MSTTEDTYIYRTRVNSVRTEELAVCECNNLVDVFRAIVISRLQYRAISEFYGGNMQRSRTKCIRKIEIMYQYHQFSNIYFIIILNIILL